MSAPTRTPAAVGAVVLLVILAAALRVPFLGQPMRYDESVTYLYFAARDWGTVFGSYLYPNNHILHTALVKLSVSLFGDAPWAIRLPAFLSGLAIIPLTYAFGRRVVGDGPALIGAALTSASGALVLYATNARGYSMVVALTLALGIVVLRLRERSAPADWALAVVLAALGVWTVPVMLFPAGGLALWFALSAASGDTARGRRDLRALAIAGTAAAALVGAMYLPVILHGGADLLTGNQFVAPSPWGVFFAQLPASIAEVARLWTMGWPAVIGLILLACVAGGVWLAVEQWRHRVPLAAALYLWCAGVLLVMHRTPFARVWLFALPLAALAAGLAVVALVKRWRGVDVPRSLLRDAAIGGAVALGAATYASRAVTRSLDSGTLRDAPAIAQLLGARLRPGDRVIAPVPANAPLQFYMLRAGIDTAFLSAEPSPDGAVYLVVNTAEGRTIDSPVLEPIAKRFGTAELVEAFPSAQLYRLLPRAGEGS